MRALTLYHGTSSRHAAAILIEGLRKPALTDDLDLAGYYAECCADEDGGEPVILAVTITDPSSLTVDVPAISEPVLCCEAGRRHQQAAQRGVPERGGRAVGGR